MCGPKITRRAIKYNNDNDDDDNNNYNNNNNNNNNNDDGNNNNNDILHLNTAKKSKSPLFEIIIIFKWRGVQ